MPAAVGHVLNGRYRLVELVGEGGMATVFRGHDTQLGRDVAVKVLRADYGRDPAFVTRFRQEAQSAAALNHPNVVNVYDYGMEAGDPYIVMELVEGGDLAEIMRERGPLDPLAAARVAQQVADALDVAHARGIVHRDIKTTNVLITRSGRVKVGDFGIARAFSEAQITLPGTTLGSVHYFSPEQARGEQVTSASDVFSLGLVLFEMLTGQRAFGGDSAGAVAVARLTSDAPAPSSINPEVPHSLDVIVRAALARSAAERPTASQLSAALTGFIANPAEPVTFGPPPTAAVGPPPAPTGPPAAAGAAATAGAGPPPPAPGQPLYGAYGGTYAGRRLARTPMAHRLDDGEAGDERPGTWAWIAAVLGVLVLVAGGLLLFLILNDRNSTGTTPTPTPALVEVPNFVGRQFADAKTDAQSIGLVLTIGGLRLVDDATPENQVLAQDRPPSDRVVSGSEVSVIVSTHSDTIPVPDLANRTESELIAILLSVDLIPGARSVEYSLDVLATNVIGTEPRAGIRVAPGTVINYVISLGPPPTPSPTPSASAAPTPSPPPTLPPTATPSPTPTQPPTVPPTAPPTVPPTVPPTAPPTVPPTLPPTLPPTIAPTASPTPTPTPTLPPTATPVPVVVGNYADCGPLGVAKENVVGAGLIVGVVFPAEAGDDWQVAQQYPTAGDSVPPGTEVHLYVKPPGDVCP